MKNSVRRYSTSALKSAKVKTNGFIRREGAISLKMDRLRKEIEKLEAKKSPAHVIRLKTNDLRLLESTFKRVQFSRVKADAQYQAYLDKNDSLDQIS